jgi:plastocyanin
MRALPRLLAALLTLVPALDAAELRLTLTDAKGNPVPDAVASLQPMEGAAPRPAPLSGVNLSQQDQEFIPFVTVVTTGTAVTFPNHDTVQHHVYSLSKAKKFELPLYSPGKAETIVFDQPGVVTLGCNIHDWMLAYLLILDTPWYAKSDAQGAAGLNAPAGKYRLEIWHPRLKEATVSRSVTLADSAGTTLTVTLTLKPDRRVRRAPDAKAGGY